MSPADPKRTLVAETEMFLAKTKKTLPLTSYALKLG
jgi:hypothetical protein